MTKRKTKKVNQSAKIQKEVVSCGKRKASKEKTIKFSVGIENIELEVGSDGPNVVAGFSLKLKGMPAAIEYNISVPDPANAFLIGLGVNFLNSMKD